MQAVAVKPCGLRMERCNGAACAACMHRGQSPLYPFTIVPGPTRMCAWRMQDYHKTRIAPMSDSFPRILVGSSGPWLSHWQTCRPPWKQTVIGLTVGPWQTVSERRRGLREPNDLESGSRFADLYFSLSSNADILSNTHLIFEKQWRRKDHSPYQQAKQVLHIGYGVQYLVRTSLLMFIQNQPQRRDCAVFGGLVAFLLVILFLHVSEFRPGF